MGIIPRINRLELTVKRGEGGGRELGEKCERWGNKKACHAAVLPHHSLACIDIIHWKAWIHSQVPCFEPPESTQTHLCPELLCANTSTYTPRNLCSCTCIQMCQKHTLIHNTWGDLHIQGEQIRRGEGREEEWRKEEQSWKEYGTEETRPKRVVWGLQGRVGGQKDGLLNTDEGTREREGGRKGGRRCSRRGKKYYTRSRRQDSRDRFKKRTTWETNSRSKRQKGKMGGSMTKKKREKCKESKGEEFIHPSVRLRTGRIKERKEVMGRGGKGSHR